MVAWMIVIVVLVLFLILPVGVDAAYREGVTVLKAKAGPIGIKVLPKKEKPPGSPEKKKKKKKKKKPKISEEHAGGKPGKQKQKLKLKPGIGDFLDIARLVLKTLSRFRRHLSLDKLHLVFVTAAPDPYDAIMLYGYLNAGISALLPLLHAAVKIRDEEILLDVDVMREKPVIELRLVATFQIWELLFIGTCAGFGFLRWFLPLRKAAKKREKAINAKPVEQKG